MDYKDHKSQALFEQALAEWAADRRSERVAVTLHRSEGWLSRRWQLSLSAVVVVMVAVVVAWIARPTVYGYVNGRTLYSLEEAQLYAQQMFDNMDVEGLQPQEDILHTIFSLD